MRVNANRKVHQMKRDPFKTLVKIVAALLIFMLVGIGVFYLCSKAVENDFVKKRNATIQQNEADEIALLSVRKGGTCNVMVLKRKNGKCSLMPYGNINFWHGGKELYFKQPYNDTIYRVSPKVELQPVRLLDLGAYEWPFDERFEESQ